MSGRRKTKKTQGTNSRPRGRPLSNKEPRQVNTGGRKSSGSSGRSKTTEGSSDLNASAPSPDATPAPSAGDEDELYGRVVSGAEEDDEEVTARQTARTGAGKKSARSRTPSPIDIVYIVPKPNGSTKSITLTSSSPFSDVRARFLEIMGLFETTDDDDDPECSLAFRLSNEPVKTRHTLEDDDDYKTGVVDPLERRPTNQKALQVHIYNLNEVTVPTKSKAAKKREEEIAKAKADAAHRADIDETVAQLKEMHPVCAEHNMHCWTGHPSGQHVQLTDIRFDAWGAAYRKTLANGDTNGISLTRPPATRYFDPPTAHPGRTTAQAESASSAPTIHVHLGDLAAIFAGQAQKRSLEQDDAPITSAELSNANWPSLNDFLLSCQESDRHSRDFPSYLASLEAQSYLGPDQIAKCRDVDLAQSCSLPVGVAQYLIDRAQLVCQEVEGTIRAAKRQRQS